MAACDGDTPYFSELSDLAKDLLGTKFGVRRTRDITYFLVLSCRRIGSSQEGWAYKVVFFSGKTGWINGISVIPSALGEVDELDDNVSD